MSSRARSRAASLRVDPVLIRDSSTTRSSSTCTDAVVERYAHRWPIETAIASGKQLLGIGQARNRLQRAVERTVPLSFSKAA